MSILDRQNLFSDKQAVTATAVSTDSYDTSNITPGRSLGGFSGAYAPRVFFAVGQDAAAAGAATVTFEVVEADDAALTTNVNVLASSGAIGKAALTAGSRPFEVALPVTSKRYVGTRYTVGTGPLTAGTFTSGIVLNAEDQRRYASAYPQVF